LLEGVDRGGAHLGAAVVGADMGDRPQAKIAVFSFDDESRCFGSGDDNRLGGEQIVDELLEVGRAGEQALDEFGTSTGRLLLLRRFGARRFNNTCGQLLPLFHRLLRIRQFYVDPVPRAHAGGVVDLQPDRFLIAAGTGDWIEILDRRGQPFGRIDILV
jgi:hypothetical protein